MFRATRMTSFVSGLLWVCFWLGQSATVAKAQDGEGSSPPPINQGVQEMDPLYDDPKLLVILIDGLRWDAINTSHVTTEGCIEEGITCLDPDSFFTRVQSEGSTAAWNSPVYPTLALTNLFTIATGVLPATHEVVEEGDSLAVPPLWRTAVNAGKKTAVLRWTRCAGEPEDPLLTCANPAPLEGIDNLLVQLVGDSALAAEMIGSGNYSLVMMRTELISWASEHYGPSSDEVQRLVEEMEAILDSLFQELQEADEWEQLSVVLVSTNGLADTKPAVSSPLPLAACLQGLAPAPRTRFTSAGSVLLAPADNAQQLIDKLESCEDLLPDAVSWHKLSDLLEVDRLNGKDDEVLVVAQPGYRLAMDKEEPSFVDSIHSEDGRLQLARAEAQSGKGSLAGAGYETHSSDMSGVFIAKGPDLLQGSTGNSVVQTDVYQLLCRQLQLAPEPHHGHWQAVSWMIQTSEANGHQMQSSSCTCCSAAMLLLVGYLFGR